MSQRTVFSCDLCGKEAPHCAPVHFWTGTVQDGSGCGRNRVGEVLDVCLRCLALEYRVLWDATPFINRKVPVRKT